MTGRGDTGGALGSIDGRLASLHHDGSGRYAIGPHPAEPLRIGDPVRLRVRAGLDAPIERILLRTTPDGEQTFQELAEVAPGAACRWWEATVELRMPTTAYRFLVVTDDGHWWLNGLGLRRSTPTDRDDFRLVAGYAAPGWLADRVFYQVFPDRFANGDPSNDVATGDWIYRGETARRAAWDEVPSRGPAGLVEFFGGDLSGIEAHLDHLQELGVNALYLNPIFDARSNHGYDIVDYEHVAAHFGGDAALASLRRATRERDIRLLLDIVPNHVGAEHPWFLAAQAAPDAPTAAYFVFREHPHDYETWLGVRSLPKLDYRGTAVREAMYAAPDAVMRRWLREPFGADGWRIDVANMLGRLGADQLGAEIAREMRAAVRAENPDAYLLGENFFDATAQLGGDEWDGTMNYAGFALPVLEWLVGIDYWSHGAGRVLRTGRSSTETLVEALATFRAPIPWALAANQYNLLDSHDTPRIRTALGGHPGRLRAAMGFLLAYLGIPSILYGDEVGLEGDEPQLARRTMPWDQGAWDLEHLAFVRSLVQARRSSPALTRGGFQVMEIGVDSLAFLRDTEDEQAVVVVARDPAGRPAGPLDVRMAGIGDGTELLDLVTGERRRVTGGSVDLPSLPAGVAIWMCRPAS